MPATKIGFLPAWKPEDHCSFFTGAEGWGLFTQKRDSASQRSKIEVRYGRLRVKTLLLAAPGQAKPLPCKVTAAGKPLAAKVNVQDSRATIQLDAETTLQAGEAIEVELRGH